MGERGRKELGDEGKRGEGEGEEGERKGRGEEGEGEEGEGREERGREEGGEEGKGRRRRGERKREEGEREIERGLKKDRKKGVKCLTALNNWKEARKTRKKKQGCSVTGYRTCNFNTKT